MWCSLLDNATVFVYNISLFVLPAKCIDQYTHLRVKQAQEPDVDVEIDPRLEAIVDRMFKRCFDDGKYKQVLVHA